MNSDNLRILATIIGNTPMVPAGYQTFPEDMPGQAPTAFAMDVLEGYYGHSYAEPCGSAGCIAGHAFWHLDSDGLEVSGTVEQATHCLGLTEAQAQALFFPYQSDVQGLVSDIATELVGLRRIWRKITPTQAATVLRRVADEADTGAVPAGRIHEIWEEVGVPRC